jgi:Trk K+ transport system NAD-binding subunit
MRALRPRDRLTIILRYARHLLWEFRWPLSVFWSLVLVGGLLLWAYYHNADRALSYGEACYAIFMMIFVETYLPFPEEWYLQPLFFIVPLIGLGAIADSLIRLGFLVFSRKQRLPEWHRMIASMYRNHFIVLGVGNVGFQVIKGLVALREPVVVIERLGAESVLIDEIVELKVPIVRGDGRTGKVLQQAGATRARAIVLATSDDLTNLDSALTARDLNPRAEIVLRLFDESLASKVRGAFSMPAISTAQVAAPAFIAAATGRKVYQSFKLGDQMLHLTDLTINPEGALVSMTSGQIQADGVVNLVLHRTHSGSVNVNPGGHIVLRPEDQILVIAPIDRLLQLEAQNQAPRVASEEDEPPPLVEDSEASGITPTPAPGEAEHPATCDLDS